MTGQTFSERDQSRKNCVNRLVAAFDINHLDSPDTRNHEQHKGCSGDHPRNIAGLRTESVSVFKGRASTSYFIIEVEIVSDRAATSHSSGGIIGQKDGVIEMAKVLTTLGVRHCERT